MLTSKERKELRAEAHHLDVLVHVGQLGITGALTGALDDALRTKELVKIGLTRTVEQSAKEIANELIAQKGGLYSAAWAMLVLLAAEGRMPPGTPVAFEPIVRWIQAGWLE